MKTCEICKHWEWLESMAIETHHDNCPCHPVNVIAALIKGIDAWARDEDGVHPDCWEAYQNAKASLEHQ